MKTAEDLIHGDSAPYVKFNNIGDSVTGKVVKATPRQAVDFKTGEPKFFKNGDPIMELVITLKTDLRDPSIDDDDGTRVLYAGNRMLKAIKAAVREHGKGTKIVGGTLAVVHNDTEDSGGAFPTKLYEASFKPGATGADQLLGAEPAQPAAPANQADPNLAAAIANLTDEQKRSLGIPV